MQLPDSIDPSLWFTTKNYGPDRKFYFFSHSPHTFYGRMHAYDPEQKQSFSVSKYEISTMSPEAGYFVQGFLAGNEPSPPEGANGPLPNDDPQILRWTRAIDLWRITGIWLDGRTCEKCKRIMLPSVPPGLVCEVCLGLTTD